MRPRGKRRSCKGSRAAPVTVRSPRRGGLKPPWLRGDPIAIGARSYVQSWCQSPSLVPRRREHATVDGSSNDPDLERPVQKSSQRGHRFSAALESRDRGTGMRQQLLARLRETRGPPIAVKEDLAQLCFEAPDLMIDSRLGDRQADRGARGLPLLGDRDEVGELRDIHNALDARPHRRPVEASSLACQATLYRVDLARDRIGALRRRPGA
jgi:hypothetical protein